MAAAFPHLRSAYPELKFASLEEIEALLRRTPNSALFSAAPHGVAAGIIDRLLTRPRPAACTRIASTSRPTFATRAPAPMNRCTSTRMARRRRIRAVHLRGAGTSAEGADAARVASRLLCDRDAARQRAAAGVGLDRDTGCSSPASPAAPDPAASRARARTIRCATAICTATARLSHRHVPGDRRLRKAGDRHRGGIQFRAAFGPVRARHPCHRAGAVLKKPIGSAQALAALQRITGTAPSCAWCETAPRVKDVATSNYSNLSAVTNGTSIAVMAVLDNLNKGAAGGAHAMDESLVGLR